MTFYSPQNHCKCSTILLAFIVRCYCCSILSLYQNWDISLTHKNARIMHALDFGAKGKLCKESRSDNSGTSLKSSARNAE